VGSDQVCSPGSVLATALNAEDGISPKTAILLKSRKVNSKIDSWEGLWHLLFPHDEAVPANRQYIVSPLAAISADIDAGLEPVVELQEVLPRLRIFLTTMSVNLRLWGIDVSAQSREDIRDRHEKIWEVFLDVDKLLPHLNAAHHDPAASQNFGMPQAAGRSAFGKSGDFHEHGHWEKLIPDLMLLPADPQFPVATLFRVREPVQPPAPSDQADNSGLTQDSHNYSGLPDDSVIDPSLR
jgi:hypothetical protein